MNEGTVATFYSYKGGLGRSFTLANVAAVLAVWGYRVLGVDWDLEAPGLVDYFRPYLEREPEGGVVELMETLACEGRLPWETLRLPVRVPEAEDRLDLLAAGRQDATYVRRMQEVDWPRLYADHDLGDVLEGLRDAWRVAYDFVLIDSRTGITDIGGICAAQMPEVLVFFVGANRQSLGGAIDAVNRAIAARNRLPYDRSRLLTLPVPSRIDAGEEYDEARRWREIFADELRPFYGGWLRREVAVSAILDRTILPYVARWSFGEDLPVVLEKGRGGPGYVSYHLETLAAVLAQGLTKTDLLIDNRDTYVAGAQRTAARQSESVARIRERVAELEERLEELHAKANLLSHGVVRRVVEETHAELERLRQSPAGKLAERFRAGRDAGENHGTHLAGAAVASPSSAALGADVRDARIITGDTGLLLSPSGDSGHLKDLYLARLARECSRLPLGIIDTRFIAAGDGEGVPLPRIYVDLDITTPARESEKAGRDEWAWRLVRGEGGGRTPLLDALAEAGGRRHVLLGDPGSGKTTFADYLCHLLADGSDALPESFAGLLPVRFVLREVAARHLPADAEHGSAGMLWQALHKELRSFLDPADAELLLGYLRDRLPGTGFVVLDGLDEVPEAGRRRRVLLEAVSELAAELDGARFLVTARPFAYAAPEWRLEGFEVLALAPFSRHQAERFIDRWYGEVRRTLLLNEDTARAKARQLRSALSARPYLGDLASRPLLLTLMATLHSSWGQLPEDRADLYEETVRLLLSRWQRAREVRGADGELMIEEGLGELLEAGESQVRAALDSLAFTVHRRQRGESSLDRPADIAESEVLEAFEPLLGRVAPERLLRYLEERTGLLVSRRQGVYAFPHRSFQEYLAASYLVSRPHPGRELRARALEDPAWWREAVLLGLGKIRRAGAGLLLAMLDALLPEDPPAEGKVEEARWRVAVLAAQALVELGSTERHGDDGWSAIHERARRWLLRLLEDGRLTPRERLGAGDALGWLGDPRPGVGVVTAGDTAWPAIEWIEIPAGTFRMGSEDGDEVAEDREKPAHEVRLERFLIGRYPVTNAQYRPFVDGGGYGERAWWTDSGWAWLQGEAPDLSGIPEDLRQQWSEWLARRPAERRRQPYWWDHPRWGAPTRPVVGVCWYEALAFSRWLDVRLGEKGALPEGLADGYRAGLPGEAHWERAARGPQGWRWPFGNAFDASACNTEEGGLAESSPVGVYRAGGSAFGVEEMAGNIWEWTRTRWGRRWGEPDFAYPYDPEDGRDHVDSKDSRILRGGSFFNNKEAARCAARNRVVPGSFDSNFGFRCVLSLANSQF